MGRKKGAIRGAAADKRRAIASAEAEAAAALMEAAEAAKAKSKSKAIVPSPVPISIRGAREAQILAVKLGPGSLVKVRSIEAKEALGLNLILERQMVSSGWLVGDEDLRAVESLALAYLLASTAMDAHYPVVYDNLASTHSHQYLLALKEWSLQFEDAAAHVPSAIGTFQFSVEAKKICRLARKVVVGGLKGKHELDWFHTQLDEIGEGLRTLIDCSVQFPVTLKEVHDEEEKVREAEKKRREKDAEGRRKKAEACNARSSGGSPRREPEQRSSPEL